MKSQEINFKFKKLSRYIREVTIKDKSAKVILDFGSMGISRYYCIEVDNKIIMHGFGRLNDAKEYAVKYLQGN